MKHSVSADQVRQYRERGYIVIDDFLTPEELEDWRTNVDEAIQQRLSTDSRHLTNVSDDDSYYSKVFLQCIKLADTHAGVHRLMHDPRLGELAGTLAGVDGIRIWHDQALFKPPFGNPTGWHLDNAFWSFTHPASLSIWVALDDATLGNGCMWYLPGTHQTARNENVGIGHNIGDLFRVYPEWLQVESVATPCKAGSAVLHNGWVAHGAGANMTNGSRRAMTCAYMPDGSTFNGQQNVLPHDYFASLKLGDPLTDPEINPLIWKSE